MAGSILFNRGWEHALLRRTGVVSASLYKAITQNQFRRGIDMEQRDLVCLPESKRPHRWFRIPNHRLSFASQEKWAWLQISFSVYLRYMKILGNPGLDGAVMDHISAKFAGIGFIKGDSAIYFCDTYPKQSHKEFKKNLIWHLERLADDGLIGKWIIPCSSIFLKKSFFHRRDVITAENVHRLLDGAREIVALDVQDLYQHVLLAEKR